MRLAELRALANQGHTDAQVSLGVMYAYGQGVPEGEVEAVKWYRKAVDQGLASAQNKLGKMYDEGALTAQEKDEEVRERLRRAQLRKQAEAQRNPILQELRRRLQSDFLGADVFFYQSCAGLITEQESAAERVFGEFSRTFPG